MECTAPRAAADARALTARERGASIRAVLELLDVRAAYGPSLALHGVTLEARAGEVVCFLGRNGAGKSTTLKAVVDLVEVTGGSIRFEGRDVTGWPTHRISRLGVGYVPEDRRIFGDLTVAENLEVGARADGAAPPSASTASSRACAGWRGGARGACPAASSRCSRWRAR